MSGNSGKRKRVIKIFLGLILYLNSKYVISVTIFEFSEYVISVIFVNIWLFKIYLYALGYFLYYLKCDEKNHHRMSNTPCRIHVVATLDPRGGHVRSMWKP